jgi:hypothetical protein
MQSSVVNLSADGIGITGVEGLRILLQGAVLTASGAGVLTFQRDDGNTKTAISGGMLLDSTGATGPAGMVLPSSKEGYLLLPAGDDLYLDVGVLTGLTGFLCYRMI